MELYPRRLYEFVADEVSSFRQAQNTNNPLVIDQHDKGVSLSLDVGGYKVIQNIHISLAQLNAGKGFDHRQAKERVLGNLSKYSV